MKQLQFWFAKFSVLVLVLVGSMAGQGWGQALPFTTGAVSADYLSAPVSDADALLPEAARLIASLKADDIDPPADTLAGRISTVSVSPFGDRHAAVDPSAPLVRIRTIVTSAPRAPPLA